MATTHLEIKGANRTWQKMRMKMRYFQNVPAYFAMPVSYDRKNVCEIGT
jgi:hypothetical protein